MIKDLNNGICPSGGSMTLNGCEVILKFQETKNNIVEKEILELLENVYFSDAHNKDINEKEKVLA